MLTHLQDAAAAPRRVVLLGAHGFLASRLQQALERASTPTLAVGSGDVDLTSPNAAEALAARLRGGDAVVFLSALTPDRGRGIDTLMANLRMAEQAAAALVRVPPAHVVYISSDAVYRETEPLIDENGPADSPSLYGTMHALRERMLRHALGASVPLALLRPTLLFGAGDTHNAYGPNRFMRAAMRDGRIALFGCGEEQRDHVFVDDAVRVVQAVLSRRSAGVLNVVTGQSTSFADLASAVAAIANGAASAPSQVEWTNVRVEFMPRADGPILHRHYDPTALLRAFPDFRFTPRDEALELAWQGHVASRDRALL